MNRTCVSRRLRKEIPITFWVMVAGTLAITGVGVVPGSASPASGRRTRSSKRLGERLGRRHDRLLARRLAALMTSFYSWRLIFLTFFGQPRWAASEHVQPAVFMGTSQKASKAHRRPRPCRRTRRHRDRRLPSARKPADYAGADLLLALGAVLRRPVVPRRLHRCRARPRSGAARSRSAEHLAHATHQVELWVKLTPTIVMLIGLWIAWNNYMCNPRAGALHRDLPRRCTASC